MPVAVITGCNSGIGHAFAKLLIDEGYDVIATDNDKGEKMMDLECSKFRLNVTSEHSIYDFKAELTNQKPVDVLLNIAGVMPPSDHDSLVNIDYQTMLSTFSVNTFGPLLLTSALLPNLKLSSEPKIGIMSSRVGSIADNTSGGSYSYRASKTAVNSIGKTLAVELKDENIPVVLLHPGIVKSGLDKSGRTHSNPEAVEPEEAASKLWQIFRKTGIEDTGKFWHREGQELPW